MKGFPTTLEEILADAKATKKVRRWMDLGFNTKEIASHIDLSLQDARRLLRALR